LTTAKSRNWLREAIVIIVLFLLPSFFFWRLLAPNPADRATIPAGDFTEQYYPLHLFASREWAQGRLPLWNPYIYGGQPALADIQSGALYPLNLLVVLWLALAGRGFPLWALEAQVILHFSLASVFTYLFVRRLSSSRFAAMVSALTFTYSGYLTSFPVQQVTILQVAVWLPLILLLLDIAAENEDPVRGRFPASGSRFWFYVTLAGLAFGCSILAGHPQTAMHVFYASVAYFAFKMWRRMRQRPPSETVSAQDPFNLASRVARNNVERVSRGAANAASRRKPAPFDMASTSPFDKLRTQFRLTQDASWLPLVRLSETYRSAISTGLIGILVFTLVAFGLAAVQLLPTLEFIGLSPRAAIDYETASWGLFWHEMVRFFFPGYFGGSPQYVGILPMVLAAMAILFERRQGDKVFWIGLGLAAFFLSLGRHTFLYNVFYVLVPGFSRVRNQERVIFLFSFSLAILAGCGATLLVRPIPRALRYSFQSFYQTLKRLGLAGLALTAFFYYGWLQNAEEGADPNFFEAALRHHVLNLLLFGGILLLLALRLRRGASRRWLMALCVGIIAFNLFTINWQFNVQDAVEGGHFPQMGFTDSLRAELVGREPFRVSSAGLLPGAGNAGVLYQLYDVAGNSPLHLASLEKFEVQVHERRRWQLLNVAYVFDLRELDSEDLEFVYIKRGVMTYRVVDALPHAWAVHEAVVAAGDEETWAVLNAPDFDPTRRVVLPHEPDIALPGGDTTGSRVEVVEYTPTRMSLQADMGDNSLLVLSDVDYPGWQARVDGQPAPIYRANYLLRAVPVEGGQHRVEVYYDPSLFKVGLAITVLTLLASGALLGGVALRDKKSQLEIPG
jgi:hypothetical protein